MKGDFVLETEGPASDLAKQIRRRFMWKIYAPEKVSVPGFHEQEQRVLPENIRKAHSEHLVWIFDLEENMLISWVYFFDRDMFSGR